MLVKSTFPSSWLPTTKKVLMFLIKIQQHEKLLYRTGLIYSQSVMNSRLPVSCKWYRSEPEDLSSTGTLHSLSSHESLSR
jgi:hypothetical protein